METAVYMEVITMRVTNLIINLKISLIFTVILCTTLWGTTIYVDDDGQADFNTIQAAIDDSNDGDTVLVAPGTYTGEGNCDIDFKGKAITVKSEEGPETCVIDCQGSVDNPHRGFYFHTNEDVNSVLQGFTITNGYDTHYPGGAIFCDISSPHIKDCIVTGNAAWLGGGIGCDSSNSVIANCIINGNRAERDRGGGIFCINSNLYILNCLITDNTAFKEGGGLKCDNSNTTISRCIIRNNTADDGGGVGIGAMGSTSSLLIMTNCLIIGNKADGLGGGIFISGKITLLNCTIFGNHAGSDGGGISFIPIEGRINNSIIYGNITPRATGSEISRPLPGAGGCNPDSIKITNSIVGSDPNGITFPFCFSGEWLYVDPLFANPGYWDPNDTTDDPNDDFWVEGDYHLKSQAGRWDPNSESWVKDDVTSPCIDTGDPNSDFSGETWPHGGRINMGAYGGTREASMSLETEGITLPNVAYIYSYNNETAESFESLLESYGCSTTLLKPADVPTTSLDSYDLIIVANDTQSEDTLSDPNTIAVIEDSNKPVVGLGDGGYDFFGVLGLSIGSPYGGHGSKNSIEVVDPNSSLFSTPYSIEIPEDRILQLYTETDHIGIYLWPTIPETVTVFGNEVNDVGYFPLLAEHNRYLLWGFEGPPDKPAPSGAEGMTETGKRLFINVVIWTANEGWEGDI
jgi:hypothetical protein